jgi:hypothetical protein
MKKIVLGILMAVSFYSNAQEKCNEMVIKNDDMTEKTTISSEYIHIGKLSIAVIAGINKGTYTKLIFKSEEGCVDNMTPIYILFESGEKIKWYNYTYSFNCEGITGFPVGNKKNQELLKNKLIKTIRVDTTKNYTQVDLTIEEAEILKKTIQCSYDRISWEDKIKYKQ